MSAARPAGRAPRGGPSDRKPREERWPELLATATQLFYEKGYEKASLQDIADRLGMLKGSLYYYFRSKEDLLFEVVRSTHEQGLTVIRAAADGPGRALDRLENVIVAHVEHLCRNLTSTAVFLHETSALPAERRAAALDEHSYRDVFRDLLEQAGREGDLRADVDLRLAVLALLGSANWVYRWYRPGGEFTPPVIGRELATLAVYSVATEAALRARTAG